MPEILGRVVLPPNTIPEGYDSHPKDKHVAVDEQGFLLMSPQTSGYDYSEGVFKVALMVWDTDTLTWVRWGGAGGASGGTISFPVKTKKFDFFSDTVLYIGEADPGALESDFAWRVRRVNFDVSGNPTQILYAASGAATQAWTARYSLSYS